VGEFIDIFEKLIPRIVDTVSVSSAHIHKLCLKRGVRPENIFSAPVGADLELFKPNTNVPINIKRKYNINNYLILYLGQLHGGQYAELFIRAARILLDNRCDATFMIVGGGYTIEALKELSTRLNMDKSIIFTGSVNHSETPFYITAADICVACFEENEITKCKSPLKIAEYLACGKAIVASNVGEVRNMVGGVGMLTKAGDVKSLAGGITTLLKDKKLREDLGKGARDRANRKYNWSVTADNLLDAYKISTKSYD
jgi:glycosyltransferase involved in cell wall biosynthesis